MNVPFNQIIILGNAFATQHYAVQRFGSDFLEQLGNFATPSESYPILYAAPGQLVYDANMYSDLASFTFTFYALDIIQKDRTNINTVLTGTSEILLDMHKYFKAVLTAASGIDIIQASTLTPVNNYLLDYVAGWSMSITFEVDTFNYCEIPIP